MAVEDDTPTETVEQQPEPKPEASPAPDPDDPPAPAPEKDPVLERVEGISKALQSVTQVVAHIQKKMDAGGDLTQVEKAKLEEASAKAAKIRKDLEAYDVAHTDEGIDKTATQGLLHVIQRQDKLEAENKALRESLDAVKFEKTDPSTKKIWAESLAKAAESLAVQNAKQMLADGDISETAYNKILQGAASDLFHERASSPPGKKLPVASPPPAKTPTGARSAHMPGAKPAADITQGDRTASAALDRLSW